MKPIFSFCITAVLIGSTFYSCSTEVEIKHGDLLFVGSSGSDLGNAITNVTENEKAKDYSHVALVFEIGDSLFVIDATPKKGVAIRSIQDFMIEESANRNSIDLYRTKLIPSQIDKGLEKISKYVGLPYNHAYLLTDTAFYCSQLIHEAFAEYKVFNMEPMTFKSEGETLEFWKEYYENLGIAIPEGVSGCNPNGMAADEDVKFVRTFN
ncbi:MAG: hypothetical protein JXQ87_11745 [Bacteroidia bacterium]